jgi:hypothetical protein
VVIAEKSRISTSIIGRHEDVFDGARGQEFGAGISAHEL